MSTFKVTTSVTDRVAYRRDGDTEWTIAVPDDYETACEIARSESARTGDTCTVVPPEGESEKFTNGVSENEE